MRTMASYDRSSSHVHPVLKNFWWRRLESVLAQKLCRRPEIIVADDGSKDDTAERMAPYADPFRYIRKENTAKPRRLNAIVSKLAKQDYIWIVDGR